MYIPSEKEINDAKLYANNVRKEMAIHLNAKLMDHVESDCFLYEYMRDYKIVSKTKFIITDVSKKFSLHHTSFIKLAKAFKRYN